MQLLAGFEWSERVAVDANQLCGDSLPDLREVFRFSQHRQSCVGVNIDESGRDNKAGGVDGPLSRYVSVIAAVDTHRIAIDQHSPEKSRTSGPVDYLAISDLQIKQFSSPND
jgi:hypothetical protein